MVNWRRIKNSIKGLFVDGKFMEQPWQRSFLDGIQFKQISVRENSQLMTSIGVEEIKMAV
uniref:Uncharacterized protein n=1 Tax=Cajanus cajan TaxID=3821 RepID=A0A151SGU8_CAJCA|nr:hypothetical protein KK1_000106 [Cajanus cajan]